MRTMLVLTAARVFDGERLLDRPTVVIDGDSIVAVGVDAPAEAEVVDLGDATLLPGLIDTHQHLVFSGQGTLEEQVVPFTDEELLARARANALTALRVGVTTIRDLGDRGYVTLSLRDDPALPTILCAGPPVTVIGGHCWYLGGECEPTGIAAAVAERAARGCDVVKVMVSGGNLTPTFPMHQSQFTTTDMHVLVDEAHRLGLPVAAHCHGTASIESAIDAGVDTIEHCTFMDHDQTSRPVDELLDRMVTAGIAFSGTLGTLPGFDPPPVIQANLGAILAAAGRFYRAGGVLVAGTDAGIGPIKPHDILPRCLTHFDEIGLTRDEALRAMTADAAHVLKLDRKGHLRPGYEADLVAVAGNPLADGDLLSTLGVWRAGARVI
jgi:imidazolonepropionase-like amidohydrolase